MKQLERAQLNAVKGGDGWLQVAGGVLSFAAAPSMTLTASGTSSQNTTTSVTLTTTSTNNKKSTK